jgi:alkylated DNA repair dioxygenase AlkB
VVAARRSYPCGEKGLIHTYSNVSRPLNEWLNEPREICERINKEFAFSFNSCLLNEYRDGSEYIGYHSDREAVDTDHLVATVSLGGPRDFHFKAYNKEIPTLTTVLNSGDLVLMSGTTQKLYKHSIPKRAHGNYRISLTYRKL